MAHNSPTVQPWLVRPQPLHLYAPCRSPRAGSNCRSAACCHFKDCKRPEKSHCRSQSIACLRQPPAGAADQRDYFSVRLSACQSAFDIRVDHQPLVARRMQVLYDLRRDHAWRFRNCSLCKTMHFVMAVFAQGDEAFRFVTLVVNMEPGRRPAHSAAIVVPFECCFFLCLPIYIVARRRF